jgi:group I intron endonuclease
VESRRRKYIRGTSLNVVYIVKNKINKKRYIGKDTDWPSRKHSHKATANAGRGFYLHSAIRKYGWDNFDWQVLEECKDREELSEREKIWITKYDPEYNLTLGGEGRCAPLTTEHKKKISKALKGNANGKGQTSWIKGKHHTEETKKKIGEASKKHRAEKFWTTKYTPKQVTCNWCGKTGGSNVMKRWHFDRCKEKDTNE